MYIYNKIKQWIQSYKEQQQSIKDNDPVHSCEVYLDSGCMHVNGWLCDIQACSALKVKRESIPIKFI